MTTVAPHSRHQRAARHPSRPRCAPAPPTAPTRVFLRAGDATLDLRRGASRGVPLREPLPARARPDRPFHVGVLMDNLPAFVFAELGCALAGATLVGLNPTRTGAALARDVEYADCQLVARRGALRRAAARGDRRRALPVLTVDGDGACAVARPGRRSRSVDDRDPQVPVDRPTRC